VKEGLPILFKEYPIGKARRRSRRQRCDELMTYSASASLVGHSGPSFKKFQSELLASDPVVRPDQVGMSLVAASGDSYG
jgi:hypothetical protein